MDFAAQFGLGRDMSVDIHATGSGLLPDPVWKQGAKGLPWFPGDSVNMGIGQGDLLATPLQMAVVAATLANRGRLVKPRMMRGIDAPEPVDGQSSLPSTQIALKQVSTQDWESMVTALEDVVHRGNQGFRVMAPPGPTLDKTSIIVWPIKSGTAQVVEISQGEEYDEEILSEFDRNHAWFIAFAPVENNDCAGCSGRKRRWR